MFLRPMRVRSMTRDAPRQLVRTDTLVECPECAAVFNGDIVGQTIHQKWHENIEARIVMAATYHMRDDVRS